MPPAFSVLIPHYSSPSCDRALNLCVEMFRENTTSQDYEVIVVRGFNDPYVFWNLYSDYARSEVLVFFNNDMLPAPGWDELMLKHVDDNSLVMGYLVEPGVISPASQNIHKDFGRKPETFQRKSFEDFCANTQAEEAKSELGWYMPVMLTKSFFIRMGRYPTDQPFPHPNDVAFWDRCVGQGAKLVRVRSFAYHFQGMSNPDHDKNR